ncbi:hypothetical protein [Pseudomonas aeruginosa]|uniref:hypothetical protein n=1 Tax=Pseudomonas aeruginosa TaxID=287 RepID=UPI003D291212
MVNLSVLRQLANLINMKLAAIVQWHAGAFPESPSAEAILRAGEMPASGTSHRMSVGAYKALLNEVLGKLGVESSVAQAGDHDSPPLEGGIALMVLASAVRDLIPDLESKADIKQAEAMGKAVYQELDELFQFSGDPQSRLTAGEYSKSFVTAALMAHRRAFGSLDGADEAAIEKMAQDSFSKMGNAYSAGSECLTRHLELAHALQDARESVQGA